MSWRSTSLRFGGWRSRWPDSPWRSDPQGKWSLQQVLAAAGVGPVLPIALLCAANGRLGGPEEPTRVRDVLVQLRGLVVRGAPGTPQEQLGVFHTTFADYLLTDPEVGIEPPEVHAALADAIAQVAPMDDHNPEDPLHRYAATAEAEHLWQAGRQEQALASIYARESHIPAENLTRLVAWYPRVRGAFGPDDPRTLSAQYRLALHTSQAGRFEEALRLFREVLSARQRLLGPNHPDTLAARHEIALCTGETGDPDEALRLYRQLLPDRERLLGPNHPNTLFTRHEIAFYTGETGDLHEALRLYRQVLADRKRVLGPSHRNTLATRHEVAYYTGKTGEPAKALDLFVELLPDEERILGADDPLTLAARANIARLLGETGNTAEALRLSRLVLADVDRILGPEHPHTETIRQLADSLQGQLGEAEI